MKVGNQVLVLLPTDNNKFLLQWKGPFKILSKRSPVDYLIDMNSKQKTFHANLLKQYVDREESKVCRMAVIEPDEEMLNQDEQEVNRPEGVRQQWPSDVNVSADLSPAEKEQVSSLLIEFSDVLSDVPGCTKLMEHKIMTTSDTPVRLKPYPIPYSMTRVVEEEVQSMLSHGFIEPSVSPYSSPNIIIKKKDRTNRFCIDMRALNRITVFDAEPMPYTEDIFAKLAGCKYFSKLDLSNWQIPLEEESKEKTAFQTPLGLFQFRVMAFGLVTAPATFTRMMRILLSYTIQTILLMISLCLQRPFRYT